MSPALQRINAERAEFIRRERNRSLVKWIGASIVLVGFALVLA